MKRVSFVLAASFYALGAALAVAGEHGEKPGEKHGDMKAKARAELGKPAPDFTLKDVDGKEHKLSDQKGKVVVLEWTCCECPFVMRHQKQQKTMQKTFAEFDGKDVVWFAIDSTNPDFKDGYPDEEIKEWAESDDVNLPYPVLRDADGKVGHLYGAKSTPHMFVIDKEGVLVYEGAIDDDPSGSKDEATNFVEAAVTAALAGEEIKVAHHPQYGCSVKYAKK